MQSDVEKAGQQLFHCAAMAGFGKHTHLHAVGDGASFIAAQVEGRLGAYGRYLVDFYHVCDYLSAAAKAIRSDEKSAAEGVDTQKDRLKSQRASEVLQALQAHLEPTAVQETDAPVRRCHRYLSHRMHQLDYQEAIARDLPIGSESPRVLRRLLSPSRMEP